LRGWATQIVALNPTSAHRINQGFIPDLGPPSGDVDFYFVQADDPETAVPRIIDGQLEQGAPGDRQGRMASGRTLSPCRLHCDEHELTGRAGGRFLQQACEQWIKEGKGAIKWTRLSCRAFAANAVRLQLHALAYNLGNFLRTLATPEPIKD
jgi:hypothetical protein